MKFIAQEANIAFALHVLLHILTKSRAVTQVLSVFGHSNVLYHLSEHEVRRILYFRY